MWKTKSLHVSGVLRRFDSKQYLKSANEKCIPFSCYAVIFGHVFLACLFDLYSKGKQCRSVLGRLIFGTAYFYMGIQQDQLNTVIGLYQSYFNQGL